MLVGACGRIGFDPITATQEHDARRADDAALSDSLSDATATACSFGVPIQVGVRLAVNTCTGRDLIDACGPAGREEVVIDFVPPTTGGYNVRAFDPGTTTVSVSSGRIDVACAGTMNCSGIIGTTFTAGQHYYFAYEAMTTACAAIEVLID
jgi:hypothetical protein